MTRTKGTYFVYKQRKGDHQRYMEITGLLWKLQSLAQNAVGPGKPLPLCLISSKGPDQFKLLGILFLGDAAATTQLFRLAFRLLRHFHSHVYPDDIPWPGSAPTHSLEHIFWSIKHVTAQSAWQDSCWLQGLVSPRIKPNISAHWFWLQSHFPVTSSSRTTTKGITPKRVHLMKSMKNFHCVTFYFMSEHIFWYQQQLSAPIIFGKMHLLLISENEFTHEIKCNGMTNFMEFMFKVIFICWFKMLFQC